MYRLKQIDFDGSYSYSNQVEVIIHLPETFSLSQNYPNPFNPTTKIRYELKERGRVDLKIYDVLGKEIADLVNKTQNPGQYTITFDGNNLPSGVYIYSLRVNNFLESKKMTLIK